MIEVRVTRAEVVQDQICLARLGRKHDCDDPEQHVDGSRRLVVDVIPLGIDDAAEEEWRKAVGGRFRLVPVDR